MRKIVLLLIIVVLILSITACSKESNEDVKEINIGFLRVPNDEAIAKQKGFIDEFFKEKDIKVNYITVDSGVEANKAFASNSIDFATMGNTNGIVALATNLDTELVWIHEVIGSIEGLVVRNGSGIEKIEDLKGKRIATTFSSTSHFMLLNVLREAGIEEEVELLDMLTVDIVAAWQRGDIDAAYTWEPSLSKCIEDNGKVIINSEDMAKKGFITANVGLARKSFANKNPELITGLLKQLDKASALYRDNPEEGFKLAAKELELDIEVIKKQMKGSIWLSAKKLITNEYMGTKKSPGKFANIMKDTADFLKEQSSISKSPSLEEFQKFINPIYIENME